MQNVTAQSWLLGGNQVATDTSLGTKNNHDLKIVTNNIERARVSANGNVGIGTTKPGFPLNFADKMGDKISFWGFKGAHYGIGIQSLLMQLYTSDPIADIAFGTKLGKAIDCTCF